MNKYFDRVIISIMAIIIVILSVFLVSSSIKSSAATRNVSWQAVTTYVDGSNIEAGNAVSYSIWYEDSVTGSATQIANKISGTSTTFDDSGLVKGRKYNFWGVAFLSSGISSDNSAKYAWTVPLGKAATIGTITIN